METKVFVKNLICSPMVASSGNDELEDCFKQELKTSYIYCLVSQKSQKTRKRPFNVIFERNCFCALSV